MVWSLQSLEVCGNRLLSLGITSYSQASALTMILCNMYNVRDVIKEC